MSAAWYTIKPNGHFDLASTMECGQAFRWHQVNSPDLGDHFEGVIHGNLVRAKQTGDDLLFTCEPDPPSTFRPILEDYLGLNHDLESIYAGLSIDPVLSPLFKKYPGLRVLRQDPWECLVSFICSANNNIDRIKQNVESMSAAFGRAIPGAESDRRAFPSPSAIAEAGEDALRDLRIGFRAKYLVPVAESVVQGAVDLFALREATYDEALEVVAGLPGVADKIGNCVLLFSLDKLESFPVDVHIRYALWDHYLATRGLAPSPHAKPKKYLTSSQVRRLRQWGQESFGTHAGYANQYLFYDDLLARRNRQD